jgi:hypothetical protein
MLLQFVYNQRVSFFELINNLSHTEKSLRFLVNNPDLSLQFILEIKLHFLFWVANVPAAASVLTCGPLLGNLPTSSPLI